MAITTYSELKTAVTNWLDRDDLTSRVDEFIDLAEARHARDLRFRLMVVRSTASTSTSSRFLALPTNYLQMMRLMLDTTPETILKQVSPYELTRRVENATGTPRFFAVHEEIEFDRTPDSAYTAEILFWQKFTALDDTNTSNDLLTNHPDVYLYSSLAAAAPFLHDDERLAIWEGLYQQAISDIKSADKQDQYGLTPLWSQPNGSTP